jgi:hypothetical protein
MTIKNTKDIKKQWRHSPELIMSGSELSSIIGCSMGKIKLAIDQNILGFPPHVATKVIGKCNIRFYTKTSIEEFLKKVDLKSTTVSKIKNKKNKKSESMETNKISTELYLEFIGVKNINMVRNWQESHLE